MKKALVVLLMLVLILGIVGCTKEEPVDTGTPDEIVDAKVDFSRLRVLIGSGSTGGDTYQSAETITRYLEDEFGVNGAVDPVGAARAFSELANAPDDGSTVMFFHDMTYLGVEFGSYDQEFALENWEIGPMVNTNPGNAFLAKHDAPYSTMKEAAEWLVANPDEQIRVAIEAGGTSEIGFHAFYLWAQEAYGAEVSDRIRAYVTGSQADKDQALWDNNADIIHGSISANVQFTVAGVSDQLKMKFLGITAGERLPGYDVPTFKEQGISYKGDPFVFDKEFFFILPKNVDPVFYAKLDMAIASIMENQPQYEQDLNTRALTKTYLPAAEAKAHFYAKRDVMRNLIENAPNLDDITN